MRLKDFWIETCTVETSLLPLVVDVVTCQGIQRKSVGSLRQGEEL
jgi:hypothetical protein